MQQVCANPWCAHPFEITETDAQFYREAGIPPPSLCPACRSTLRCLHRNERSLHRRTCDLCEDPIVSMYRSDAAFPVYCPGCFYSDRWTPFDFGRSHDSDVSFFSQLTALYAVTPRLAIMNKQSQNSDYCNYSYANKNCYLTSGSHYEEDCLYGAYSTKNRDCMDSLWIYGSELLYECMFSKNCYYSGFLDHCEDAQHCYFSRDLKGCSHCLFSANLRQKQYCVFNEQKTEEEYTQILQSLQLHTASGIEAAKRMQKIELPNRFPVRALNFIQCEQCEGDTLSNCKNMRQCFYGSDSEDCAYGVQIDGTYSSMDIDYMGYDRSERLYQAIGCLGLFDCIASNACWNGSGLRYCQYCFSCNDCFGCMSLKQQKYCILNKQYAKEEYEKMLPRIIDRMRTDGSWGAYFPPSLSPFGYNESMTQDWLPLKRDDAEQRGYIWKEDEQINDISRIIDATALPDSIDDIPDDVFTWAIRCAVTNRPFRIVRRELDFYRKCRLPLPRVHSDERHRQRKALRNPRRLWDRHCANCHKSIVTSYSPNRPEIVYCESCYLQIVY